MHPINGVYLSNQVENLCKEKRGLSNPEDLYNTEMRHIINAGDFTIEEYLNAIETLIKKVRRKVNEDRVPIINEIPSGIVSAKNEGTGVDHFLGGYQSTGRNMNEDY
jgi:hypothetical protein